MVDASSVNKDAETTLLRQDGCWKKVFERHGYLLIVLKDPTDPNPAAGNVVFREKKEASRYSQACLTRAESDIHGMGLSFADRVLTENQRINLWSWRDMDIGPVFWVKCGATSPGEYNDSLVTLIHESVHALRQNDCIFVAESGQRACFDLAAELPPRGVAAYKTFPFKIPEQVEGYKYLQRIYLEQLNEGPLLLFDELNAYTATTLLYARIITQNGKSGLFAKDGRRSAIFLTAFMAWTVRYLEALSKSNPELSRKYFGPETKNMATVSALLTDAEKAYINWTRALAAEGEQPKEGKDWFLQEYRFERMKIGFGPPSRGNP